MINGNRIQFGYGDIGVKAGLFGNIEMHQFKPPQECGSRVNHEAVEWIGKRVSVGSSCDDLKKLDKQLKAVEEQRCFEFEFDGYIFDFTNYNVESIRVCRKHVRNAIGFAILPYAC